MAGVRIASCGPQRPWFLVAAAVACSWCSTAWPQAIPPRPASPAEMGLPPQGLTPDSVSPMSTGPEYIQPGPATIAPPLTSGGVMPPMVPAPLVASPHSTGAVAALPPGVHRDEIVVDVRVVGLNQAPLVKVAPFVRTRAGRPFDLEVVEGDVRRLNQSKMFVTVKTFTRRAEGGLVVIFDVLERPMLNYVKIIGNSKINTKQIKKEIELKTGDPLDPFAVTEGQRKIEELYHTKGFPKARVTVIEGDKPTDPGAVFLINEGEKQKIFWTQFQGNTVASEARLRTQIESKPGFLWIFKGEVDRKKIDDDIDKLTAYYHSLGFFRVRVGRELDFNEAQSWLTLTFVIDEGPRYVVRDVAILGNTKFPNAELTAPLKLKAGDPFIQASLTRDVMAMQDKYGAIGYVFAEVKPDIRFLEEPGQLDLVYQIREGDRYHVGAINVNIEGEYPRTSIATVLNRISLHPGQTIDTREIRDSERRIQASTLFQSDPASGVKPRIVMNAPELEKADNPDSPKSQQPEVARDPNRRPRFRGQSPAEPAPADPQSLPPPAWYPGQAPAPSPWPQQPPPAGQQDPSMVIRGQAYGEGGISMPSTPRQPYYSVPSGLPASPNGSYAAPPSYPAAPSPAGTNWTPVSPDASAAVSPPPYGVPPGGSYAPVPPPPGTSGAIGAVPSSLPPAYQPVLPSESVFADPSGPEITRPLPLDVFARETETGRLMLGVGINSDAGLFGQVMIDERNFDWTRWPSSWEDVRNGKAFRGAGQQMRIEAVPGTQFQRYMFNFREPYLFNTDIALLLSGYYYTRRYTEWDEQRFGGKPGLGYQFDHNLSGTVSARIEQLTLSNPIIPTPPELASAVGKADIFGFEGRLAHDTRDSPFLATQGHLWELSVEQVLGTHKYVRGEVDLRRHFTLTQRADGSGRHVLTLMSRFAASEDDTPIYDHFYAGGFTTIRGFSFRTVSPRTLDVAVGGNAMLLASAEYMFPITADDMLRGVVFCDSGTVQRSVRDWSDVYRVAPGFGLRITVPALGPAPIALDFAFPVASQSGDRKSTFSFFIGLGRN